MTPEDDNPETFDWLADPGRLTSLVMIASCVLSLFVIGAIVGGVAVKVFHL